MRKKWMKDKKKLRSIFVTSEKEIKEEDEIESFVRGKNILAALWRQQCEEIIRQYAIIIIWFVNFTFIGLM